MLIKGTEAKKKEKKNKYQTMFNVQRTLELEFIRLQ